MKLTYLQNFPALENNLSEGIMTSNIAKITKMKNQTRAAKTRQILSAKKSTGSVLFKS
jgi:hypothetical protein